MRGDLKKEIQWAVDDPSATGSHYPLVILQGVKGTLGQVYKRPETYS